MYICMTTVRSYLFVNYVIDVIHIYQLQLFFYTSRERLCLLDISRSVMHEDESKILARLK